MKSFTFSVRVLGFIFSILFVLSFSYTLRAQVLDNPNLDQLPLSMRQNPPQHDLGAPMSTVITVGNWDNFNLGTDFGESNMAAKLSQPNWYFTAYNTNTTHGTQNGIDWSTGSPNFGANMQGDPVVAYDSLGNLFYENLYGASSIQGVKVIKSTDNGATWNTAVTALAGIDKNWMACDQTNGPYTNYVYVCMTANSGGNFARSTDHGATFTTTFTPGTQNIPGMMVCVGPYNSIQGGSVFVVTNSGSAFTSTYTFYRSLDGGANFSLMSSQQFCNTVGNQVNGRNSVEGMRTRPYPMIAADNSYGPHRGRLYCVYASNDPPGNGNKPDIWCRYSDDGGTTWNTTAIRVNDDSNPQSHHQWHPAIWCDKNTGRLYCQFMDTRDTPTHDSAYIYATYSDNGGVTWAANQRISNKKMKIDCPSCGGGGSPRYQGDYNGIISNNKIGMAGWTDFRNGSFMSATAYFPDFAMSIDHDVDTLYTLADTAVFNVNIPEVKLYTDTVVLSGTITPVPSQGTITFYFPGGNIITNFPNYLPVDVVLGGDVPVGNYTANFFAKGPNETPAHKRTATIRVKAGSNLQVTTTATPQEICQGLTSQLAATVLGGAAPITYHWTPGQTLNDSTISNPVATPMQTTTYVVNVTDANNKHGQGNVTVTVDMAPGMPGTITGTSEACKDSVVQYSIPAVPGATSYSWTVPPDATIQGGQNTTQITVKWGSTSGNVSVIAGNTCGNSNPSVKPVTAVMAPAAPSAILGPASACSHSLNTFYVDSVAGATAYTWATPRPSVIIQSGQGTKQVTILWDNLPGDLSVFASSICGTSPPAVKSLSIDTIPVAPGAITGADTVCKGHNGYPYSVAPVANALSYQWTLPIGATVASGIGTNSITVDFASTAQSGSISVLAANDCGDGPAVSKSIVVNECSSIPENSLEASVKIYPNPANETMNILINGKETQLELQIIDARGRVIYTESLSNIPAEFLKQVDVSKIQTGIYFVRLVNSNRSFNQKIMID